MPAGDKRDASRARQQTRGCDLPVTLSKRCRLCAGPASLLGDRRDIALYRCAECRFVSGFPSDDLTTEERYAGYHAGGQPPAPEGRYEEWLGVVERSVGRGRLLEVGAGRGAFVRVALRRGWAVTASEVSEAGVRDLHALGVEVIGSDLRRAGLADGAYDAVVSLEVLEHLPEPAPHLRELHRVTRPEGVLLLTTPNFAGLSRRWLGLRWRVVTPEHLGYFEPRTLARALAAAGFEPRTLRSRSLDVSSWITSAQRGEPSFDPHASAQMRDAVEKRAWLRLPKEALNLALGLTGLGDSLLVWARRQPSGRSAEGNPGMSRE